MKSPRTFRCGDSDSVLRVCVCVCVSERSGGQGDSQDPIIEDRIEVIQYHFEVILDHFVGPHFVFILFVTIRLAVRVLGTPLPPIFIVLRPASFRGTRKHISKTYKHAKTYTTHIQNM